MGPTLSWQTCAGTGSLTFAWSRRRARAARGGGAGFVFDYSNDGVGHGYTTTGPYSNGEDSVRCTNQSISGNDPWIVENWDDLIAGGIRVGSETTRGGSAPDIVSYTLEGSGFATLQNLAGARASPISQGANIDGSCWYATSTAWGSRRTPISAVRPTRQPRESTRQGRCTPGNTHRTFSRNNSVAARTRLKTFEEDLSPT
jgi:hypothetical protein